MLKTQYPKAKSTLYATLYILNHHRCSRVNICGINQSVYVISSQRSNVHCKIGETWAYFPPFLKMRRTAVLRWDCSMWSSGCWANLSLYYPPHCNPPRELPLAHSHHFPRTSQTAVLGPPRNLSHCPYLSRRRQ